ncbi:hypothetical protein IV203_006469 [Nitzschia inconspicua]|uniref:Uncharacterized protein n=1 Tax=Nitzschia inconspicua TaxID=303405 RepID=A0A9K3KBA6_9STRA|nr:hypothetical protein IV203_006469 [Nitzschia inconspicua]
MTSRKLQTTQITSFFQRKECIGGTTSTNTNAAVETAAVATTPRQDVSTAASSSSSLVATQTSTGPSARLVTTTKKRTYTSLSSTDSTPALSSFFLPRGRTTDKKPNINNINKINNSCIVVGNTPSQSPNCNTRKNTVFSSSQCGSTPNRFAQYDALQEDLSITSSSSDNISQDDDGLHEEDQEEDKKPRSKPSFPQEQSKETLSEQDHAIVDDIIPQEIIDLENQEEEDDDDDEEENVSDEHNETTVGHQSRNFRPIEKVGDSSLQSGNFRNFVENHLSPELKDQLLQVYDASTANTGNRTTGPNKAATKVQIASNDGSVAELLKTHAPQDGKLDGERFWIRDKQDPVAHPANGTPSTDPSIHFPDGKIVYDDLCLEGLRERFKKRIRQGTCRNTAKAIRYPQFELKTCMVKKQTGRNRCAVSSGGYILVYIVKKETKPNVKKSGDAAVVVVPLELHSTQRVKITNWTQQYRECVVCVVKARQQHPDWNRNKLRKQKIVRYSCSGCPQCKKGKGVAVCEKCWDEFDHAKFMM